MKKPAQKTLAEIASKIKLLIMDVDGVLTDGTIIIDDTGRQTKAFNVRDGHGIKMLHRIGVKTALITGRSSRVVTLRARELGITEVHQGSKNKLEAYARVLGRFGLTDEETAFMGDDIVDLPVMVKVALPITVTDAHEEVIRHALMVTTRRGGQGAVREVTDFIIKTRGLWDGIIKNYTKT